jgi:two-component system nitrate/nitrite response regulator NarL
VIVRTSLVIGDDHAVFLDALVTLLEQREYTIAAARTAAETVAAVARLHPDVCLLDRHFAEGDGLGVIALLLAASPRTRVLVLSADPGAEGVRRALSAGASGYLHKTRGVSALTAAIGRVLRGEVVVDVPRPAGARRAGQHEAARRLAAYLTGRERQCLALLVEGMDTAHMAARLQVSRATVRTHVQSLLTKLGVHSRLEAASLAVRCGLLEGGGQPPG